MDASCAFAFVGPNVTRLPPAERKFVYLSNIRSPATRSVSPRLFSKLPKLSPHILFPRKWTVFFDSKLQMRASMDELWAVYESRVLQPWRDHSPDGKHDITPFTAILHPYAWIRNVVRDATFNHASAGRLGGKEFLALANQSAFKFMQTEASLLLTPHPKPCPLLSFSNHNQRTRHKPCDKAFKPLRVANASILRHQIERYVALSTTVTGPHADSYRYYIDTALLMQQDAGMLYEPWRAEMARTDSCDRDQISFAHTTARLQLKMRLLRGCHAPVQRWPTAVAAGKQLCHWYIANASTVADVKRTDLDGPVAAGSVASSARAATPRQKELKKERQKNAQPKPRTRAEFIRAKKRYEASASAARSKVARAKVARAKEGGVKGGGSKGLGGGIGEGGGRKGLGGGGAAGGGNAGGGAAGGGEAGGDAL